MYLAIITMRILYNKDLCDLYRSCGVRIVKSKRMQIHGSDGQDKIVYRILVGKPLE
jgi:hypothetical protein